MNGNAVGAKTGARVLVVDDEETVREEMCEALRDAGMTARGVGNAQAALDATLSESYDVCISDIRMPGMDGIELLRRLRDASPETLVIMITAYGEMKTCIDALRLGAADYVLKPVLLDDILAKVARSVEHRKLLHEVRNLRRAADSNAAAPSRGMVGDSAAMHELVRVIEKVAPTRSNVLIAGESGTGKELIARAIHDASDRAASPFVPINCAAIPETLLESELFGHMKGAFTGAVNNKEGLLKTAGEGTIFLDELGDMPMSIQAKLLRAIESHEIQPVGSVRRIPIHARIIAATNKDLQKQIEAGAFREDLYYRMAVVDIRAPALRERREDVPLLVRHFIEKYNGELGRRVEGVDNEALRLLAGHAWRGNIRELENTIERAMIFCTGGTIHASDLPEVVRGATPLDLGSTTCLARAAERFERAHIRKVLGHFGGDKRKAAKALEISLSSLYRKLDGADGGVEAAATG